MDKQFEFVIVGGGLSGLFTAKVLLDVGRPFVGLDKTGALGGHSHVGHHRLYDELIVDFARNHVPSTDWKRIDEDPTERKKGEWRAVEEECTEEESFYLGKTFFAPTKSYDEIIASLVDKVGERFQLLKNVESIDGDTRTIECVDGSKFQYQVLLWCTELELLRKVWRGESSQLLKALKSLKEIPGGLNLDFQLHSPLFPQQNTVVFPFRYKDHKLKALGVSENLTLHWLLFLDEEISEDREEVAKCVRALKRELQREFPKLKELTKNEKILYCSTISGGMPAEVKSLDILPGVMYIGPQVRLPDSGDSLRHLDRTLANVRHFQTIIQG